MRETFKAYWVTQQNDGSSNLSLQTTKFDQLDKGDVLIKSLYSGINYKDVLAATGAGRVLRRFPCIPGVDVAGIVVYSNDPRYQVGDAVLVTGYGMGVDHHGGFSEYVSVPADWVVPVPDGLSLFDAMALGTAGFTAALAVHRLQQNELSPEQGAVLVTGATGGVSSWVIQILNQLGFYVVALTRKRAQKNYLTQVGAKEVLFSDDLKMGHKPLESARWAAAFDSVGGETLAWLTRTMSQGGQIASYGNTGGTELNTTVLPFILRGIRLIGIDSAATQQPVRNLIWQRLASDLKPSQIHFVTKLVDWQVLPELLPKYLSGEMSGRVVLQFNSEIV